MSLPPQEPLAVGSCFASKKDLVQQTTRYCAMIGKDTVIAKSDKTRVTVRCPSRPSCPFFVKAKPNSLGKWEIKKLWLAHCKDCNGKRKRSRKLEENHHDVFASGSLPGFVVGGGRSATRQLQEMLQTSSGRTVSYKQAHDYLKRTSHKTPDRYLRELRTLEDYLEKLSQTDPDGTYALRYKHHNNLQEQEHVSYTIHGETLPGHELAGFYVGWGWTKRFWKKNPRKVLFVDACPSLACFGGMLVAIVAKDAANDPVVLGIAYIANTNATASDDDDEHWAWIIAKASEHLGDCFAQPDLAVVTRGTCRALREHLEGCACFNARCTEDVFSECFQPPPNNHKHTHHNNLFRAIVLAGTSAVRNSLLDEFDAQCGSNARTVIDDSIHSYGLIESADAGVCRFGDTERINADRILEELFDEPTTTTTTTSKNTNHKNTNTNTIRSMPPITMIVQTITKQLEIKSDRLLRAQSLAAANRLSRHDIVPGVVEKAMQAKRQTRDWLCTKASASMANGLFVAYYTRESAMSDHWETVSIRIPGGGDNTAAATTAADPTLSCTCRMPLHTGHPCHHGMLALATAEHDPYFKPFRARLEGTAKHWYHIAYHVSTYVRQYNDDDNDDDDNNLNDDEAYHPMMPMVLPDRSSLEERELWPSSNAAPTNLPVNKRRKRPSSFVPQKEMRCQACGQVGHNRKSCLNPNTAIVVQNTEFYQKWAKQRNRNRSINSAVAAADANDTNNNDDDDDHDDNEEYADSDPEPTPAIGAAPSARPSGTGAGTNR